MAMEYAIIRTGGKQYKVLKGSSLEVDKINDKDGLNPEILLLVSDGSVKIGRPTLSNVKIKSEIISNLKGDKIRVGKFKAKARQRRIIGFRPSLTKVMIKDIISGNKSDSKTGSSKINKSADKKAKK